MGDAPAFKGGQGRTAREVRAAGHRAAWTILAAFAVVVLSLSRCINGH
jgi:hypothetical protein